MKIKFLGDSITFGYALENKSKKYSTLVCNEFLAEEENFGITGTLMARSGLNMYDDKAFLDRLNLLEGAEIAVIFGGTNDYFWTSDPIYPKDLSDKNTKYFINAINEICRFCKERPQTKFLIVTPYPHHGIGNYYGGPIWSWDGRSEHDTSEPNICGHVLLDYVNVLEECAQKYDIPVLNLHKEQGFDWTKHTIDGCHPNEEGHKWLADKIVAKLKDII
jgi:lysophospholipase L1-like esterase